MNDTPPTSHTICAARWHVGDWAEIRPLDEILETLDNRASLEAMPFMPEMIPYCGRRFQVVKVAHKTCDSSGWNYLRTLKNAVHLDLRCDGSHHGGCQAGCRFFWKTAWLRKVDGPSPVNQVNKVTKDVDVNGSLDIFKNIACMQSEDGDIRYRCQATEIKNSGELLHPWQLSQYAMDLSSGNVTFAAFVRYTALALLKTTKVFVVVSFRSLKTALGFKPPKKQSRTPAPLNLKSGDKVRIKSWDEILETLNVERRNSGLLFDPDMIQFCGTTQEVVSRVERIIDEGTGKMIHLSRDGVILKDIACTGLNCRIRLFCPRGQPSFWREAWLEKILT